MATKSPAKPKETLIKFKMAGLRTEHFILNIPIKKFNSERQDIVNYNINCTIPNQIVNNCIIILLKVTAIIIETKEILCEIHTAFRFEIESIDNTPLSEMKEIKIPDGILTTFVSISVSTIRGILLEKCRGTILEKQIMPVIDPKTLVGQMMENIPIQTQKTKSSM